MRSGDETVWAFPNHGGPVDISDLPLGALRWLAELGIGIDAVNLSAQSLMGWLAPGSNAIASFWIQAHPYWDAADDFDSSRKWAFLSARDGHGQQVGRLYEDLGGQQQALNALRSLGVRHA